MTDLQTVKLIGILKAYLTLIGYKDADAEELLNWAEGELLKR